VIWHCQGAETVASSRRGARIKLSHHFPLVHCCPAHIAPTPLSLSFRVLSRCLKWIDHLLLYLFFAIWMCQHIQLLKTPWSKIEYSMTFLVDQHVTRIDLLQERNVHRTSRQQSASATCIAIIQSGAGKTWSASNAMLDLVAADRLLLPQLSSWHLAWD